MFGRVPIFGRENMAALKNMMADPSFQSQAKRVAEQMKASGDMPDFSQLQQAMNNPALMAKAQQMMQQMGAGGSSPEAELARLRAENAALKQRMQ